MGKVDSRCNAAANQSELCAVGGLGLPDISYYSSDHARIVAVRGAYSSLIDDLFALVGHTGSAADVIAFETRLANMSLSREQRRDPLTLYNPTTMREFKSNYTELAPFMTAFSETFNSFGKTIVAHFSTVVDALFGQATMQRSLSSPPTTFRMFPSCSPTMRLSECL